MVNNNNITRHALMRYISRRELSKVITDNTFDSWRKEFPDKLEEYTEMMKSELANSIFITERAFETHKKASFFINIQTLMVFVINDSNVITCYRIEYGVGEDIDRQILASLILGKENKEAEVESTRNEVAERKNDAYERIKQIKQDLAELEVKQNALRKQIKTQEAIIEELEAKEKQVNTELFSILTKIVRPKNSL